MTAWNWRKEGLRAVAGLVTAAIALGVPGSASADCGGVVQAEPSVRLPYRPPLAIGDSILLGALPYVVAKGFEVNAHGCREMSEGLALLRARLHAGTLPHLVVIALGTNLYVTQSDIETAKRILGPNRVLVLLTPRKDGGGFGPDAQLERNAARADPNHVHLIDWVRLGAMHREWFDVDDLHLLPAGGEAMARLLAAQLPFAPPAPCAP